MAPKQVTTTGMGIIEGTFWAFAVVCSCGLLYPVYRARKHRLDRTFRTN